MKGTAMQNPVMLPEHTELLNEIKAMKKDIRRTYVQAAVFTVAAVASSICVNRKLIGV